MQTINDEYEKTLTKAIDDEIGETKDEKSYINASLNVLFEARKAK
nr:MAG TPA_asm: hypothetical protein [Bacteriophage sp.]